MCSGSRTLPISDNLKLILVVVLKSILVAVLQVVRMFVACWILTVTVRHYYTILHTPISLLVIIYGLLKEPFFWPKCCGLIGCAAWALSEPWMKLTKPP